MKSTEMFTRHLRAIARAHDSYLAHEYGFSRAIIHLSSGDPVTFTGVGKSGMLADRVAATARSLGINARYVHATEAMHGDMELLTGIVVAVSHSGQTGEVLVATQRAQPSVLIAVTGYASSLLAQRADVVLPYGPMEDSFTAPSESLAAAAAVLDTVIFSAGDPERLKETHPGGTIGERL